ncbi:MAG: PAS domain S-box protein, partial [Chloroflexi bacterium]|nr:PAS domain S-box protein [Chloroflexota bacterium]
MGGTDHGTRTMTQDHGELPEGTALQGALADLEKQVTERMAELRQAVDRLSFEAARRQRAVSPEEAQFRSIFEAGSEGYLIHDDGIIVEVNPQLEALLGYESSELIGRSLMTLVAEESKALVAERLRTKPRKPYEITGVKKDGTRIQVEVVGKDHLHEGRPMAVVTIRDLTDQKEADEALREKDEWL